MVEAEREVRSLCRVCLAVCGIRVTVRGDEVVAVRGDADHPLSRGYTCTKGRAMAAFHSRADRLNEPMLRGAPVDWRTILNSAGAELHAVRDEFGPNAIGFYSGMGEAHDRAGAWAKRRFFSELGTPQCYTAATVDCAPGWRAAELVTGYVNDLTLEWEPERSPRAVIFIGANPAVSHGVTNVSLPAPAKRLRDFVRGGGDLWVIDPRRSETAALASHHVAPVPGTDPLILAWLVRELLRDGADECELRDHAKTADVAILQAALEQFDLDAVASRCGIDPAVLETLLASVRASGTVACLGGTGVGFNRHGLVTEWLIWVLHIITGSADRPDGMRVFNNALAPKHERATWEPAPDGGRWQPGPVSRPELSRWFGEFPVAAMVDEIEAGNLRALLVLGANPLTAFPQPERTAAALRKLRVLGVFDVLHNSITELGTHVFPMVDMFERPDIDGRGSNMFAPVIVPALGQRRPEWWVLAHLARRLDLDILDGTDPDECRPEEIAARANRASAEQLAALEAAGPYGLPFERPFGWVRERALPDGRWRLAPTELVARLPELLSESPARSTFRLTARRRLAMLNSVAYTQEDRIQPGAVVLHPDDAARIGVGEGASIRITTAAGSISGRVLCDVGMKPGTVFLPHGATEHNVNQLVNRTETVDPLTGQPWLSAFSVEIAAP